MRRIVIALAVIGLVSWTVPAALAQSSSNGGAGGSSSSGGTNRSSLRVRTSGGAAVGVTQGSVASGSRSSGCNGGDCSGDQQGSASSGGAGAGQTAGVVSAPATNATEDGVVNQASLPALELGEESQTASADRRPSAVIWALAALIVVGMVVLYRRLPRSTPA